jgi:hypothetical protein
LEINSNCFKYGFYHSLCVEIGDVRGKLTFEFFNYCSQSAAMLKNQSLLLCVIPNRGQPCPENNGPRFSIRDPGFCITKEKSMNI